MRFICAVLLVLLMAHPVAAGTLKSFEKAATLPGNHGKDERSFYEVDEDSGVAELLEELVVPVAQVIAFGGINSSNRVSGAGEEPRRSGDALLARLRVDACYQKVEDDVDAFDLRAEAGYGFFGIQTRHTRFWEVHPADTLGVTQAHLLYRMSFGSQVECDLGVGALLLDGRRTTSGISFTLPLLIHPTRNFGVEFRPAWGDMNGRAVDDYDLAVLLGDRHVSLKLGYRWLMSGQRDLSGPEAGVSLYW